MNRDLIVMLVVALTSVATNWAAPVRDCDPYAYCDGTVFNASVLVGARRIRCDTVPHPRDRCCLPQAKHLVCYGISVDGQYLNYDKDNYAQTTDFTGLCSLMARAEGKKTGKHSAAITETSHPGTASLMWRYGEWTPVAGGSERIKNIACEIVR